MVGGVEAKWPKDKMTRGSRLIFNKLEWRFDPGGYIHSFRRRVVRVRAQMACMANSKVANVVSGNPIAPEGMPPTDGLLAGVMCLSPALVHPLSGAVVAHVVGNMEEEGLNL